MISCLVTAIGVVLRTNKEVNILCCRSSHIAALLLAGGLAVIDRDRCVHPVDGVEMIGTPSTDGTAVLIPPLKTWYL